MEQQNIVCSNCSDCLFSSGSSRFKSSLRLCLVIDSGKDDEVDDEDDAGDADEGGGDEGEETQSATDSEDRVVGFSASASNTRKNKWTIRGLIN